MNTNDLVEWVSQLNKSRSFLVNLKNRTLLEKDIPLCTFKIVSDAYKFINVLENGLMESEDISQDLIKHSDTEFEVVELESFI